MGNVIQIDVKKAAALIQVTERTILNLIKLRKFEAIKVGKEWFIDYASFVSFIHRYKYQKNIQVESELNSSSASLSVQDAKIQLDQLLDRLNASPKKSDHSIEAGTMQVAGPSGVDTRQEHDSREIKVRSKKNIYNLSSLRVYELIKQVFSEKLKDTKINERFKNHIYLVIENIGSGYYSYNQEVKIISYVEARKKLGALLALIQSNDQQKNEWQKEILTIEVDVLSALGALTRKLEKKVSHAKD